MSNPFDQLLWQADIDNERRQFNKTNAHLPAEIEEAVRFHREQIKRYHAAILVPHYEAADKIEEEAHNMAVRVNGGEPGILAGPDAPGEVLARRCQAKAGKVPMWGQKGLFNVQVGSCVVQIKMDGMFGLRPPFGFAAYAVELDKPFISETGFRSFLSGRFPYLEPNTSTHTWATRAIEEHIGTELKGKLIKIKER
jgi:hypothetical protein